MKILQVVFILSMLVATPLMAIGEREGGGGIIISAEFAKTGRNAIEILGMGDDSLSVSAIMNAIVDTKVVPVEKICHTEPTTGSVYCENAHYDKDTNVIIFAYGDWEKMSCMDKILISSHEFLRAAGLEGEDYKYSGRFIDKSIVQCTQTSDCADRVVQIDRLLNVFCEKLASYPDVTSN